MPQPLEGSQAIARTVARCRPEVVAAYPITPQTHIVEGLAGLIANGECHAELVSVESEFSAASVVLGAAAAGSRSYTATASQGIMLMSEVLYNIAGLRVPLVLTCANRALSAPLSIWNDHQDAMAVRDAGWIQLYCADNQEAVDTSVQAYRIAERTELPVMVCMDGFVLTHTLEVLEMPTQEQVDGFLPPYRFSRTLDPQQPGSYGMVVTPEYFTEIRHAHHQAMLRAKDEIVAADGEWAGVTGRPCGGLLETRGDESARTGILAMGSIVSTFTDAAEQARGTPHAARLIKLRSFRPFPAEALREACAELDTLVVVERALSPGLGGIVGAEVRAALSAMERPPRVLNYAVGLGGRDVRLETWAMILDAAAEEEAGGFRILDLEPEKLPPEAR